MIQIEDISVEGKELQYIRIDMWGAPLVMIKGKKGYVMCGYLNMQTANKIGDMAVRVTGVRDLETVMSAKVAECSEAAEKAGIKPGDEVSSIVSLL